MKRVEAYIQPFMLTRVLHELREVDVRGLTVSDVRGFGRGKDESHPHHGSEHVVDFTPKLKLEILCRDLETETLVEALLRGAHTGRKGDGKVFVTDVAEVVSIRSRDSGDEAI